MFKIKSCLSENTCLRTVFRLVTNCFHFGVLITLQTGIVSSNCIIADSNAKVALINSCASLEGSGSKQPNCLSTAILARAKTV